MLLMQLSDMVVKDKLNKKPFLRHYIYLGFRPNQIVRIYSKGFHYVQKTSRCLCLFM